MIFCESISSRASLSATQKQLTELVRCFFLFTTDQHSSAMHLNRTDRQIANLKSDFRYSNKNGKINDFVRIQNVRYKKADISNLSIQYFFLLLFKFFLCQKPLLFEFSKFGQFICNTHGRCLLDNLWSVLR